MFKGSEHFLNHFEFVRKHGFPFNFAFPAVTTCISNDQIFFFFLAFIEIHLFTNDLQNVAPAVRSNLQ